MKAIIPAALVTGPLLRSLGYDAPAQLAADLQALMAFKLSEGYELVCTITGHYFPITVKNKRIICELNRDVVDAVSANAIRVE